MVRNTHFCWLVIFGTAINFAFGQVEQTDAIEELPSVLSEPSDVQPPPDPQPLIHVPTPQDEPQNATVEPQIVAKPKVRYADEGTVLRSHEFGVSMNRGDSGATVRGVIVGSPAHQAGVRPGDKLLAVDGQNVSDVQQAIQKFQELADAKSVSVQIDRKGVNETVEVDMTSGHDEIANGNGAASPQSYSERQARPYRGPVARSSANYVRRSVPGSYGVSQGYSNRSAPYYEGYDGYGYAPRYYQSPRRYGRSGVSIGINIGSGGYGPGYGGYGRGYGGYGRGYGYGRGIGYGRGYGYGGYGGRNGAVRVGGFTIGF